jgi:hypothetical protein
MTTDRDKRNESDEFEKRKTIKFERPVIRNSPTPTPGTGDDEAIPEEKTDEYLAGSRDADEEAGESPAGAQESGVQQPEGDVKAEEEVFDTRETGTFRKLDPAEK